LKPARWIFCTNPSGRQTYSTPSIPLSSIHEDKSLTGWS
jgi:hypothetical protein